MLNLFLALLLSSFGASNLSQAPAGDDTKGIAEAFNRIARGKRWVKNKLLGLLKVSVTVMKKKIQTLKDRVNADFQFIEI